MVGKPLQISVVIPAYNEAERIAPTLVEAHAFFSGRNDAYEIVVVDDGSTDRTAEIVERMALDMPQLRLVRMDKNSGKGAAVARGMVASKGVVRLFADADGSTPFDEFPKLEAAIAAGASVAFGSRALPDSVLHPPQPKLRTVLGRGSNLIIQMTNLPGVKDSQCGFKAFTAEAAEAIFPHLKMHRWGFDIEILVMARRLGLKSTEVAVYWRDRAGSKLGLLKPKAYLQTLWEDLRIRYNALTGAYPKKR
jgi:glycosyltransferase involved in cell wall biosynthesis